MKKLILAMVFVFATGTMMNASNNSIEELVIINPDEDDCTQAAWDWGTEAGEGNEEDEYEYTNSYFEYYCNEDGSFKDDI